VWTRKGSVRFFDKMRGLEAIGSAAFAAALLGLFSFRLSHSVSNKSFNPRVVKSSVSPDNLYQEILKGSAKAKIMIPKMTRYQTNKPSP